MEKVILRAIEKHLRDNVGIDHRQHGFRKEESCLTIIISFYAKVTHPVDQGEMWGFYFSKAFDIVSQYPSGQNVQHTATQIHHNAG